MNAHGLGGFLLDLRRRGLPVGPLEVDRIATILEAGPSLSKDQLRELFASVVLTRPEQRAKLDLAFETWWDVLATHAEQPAPPEPLAPSVAGSTGPLFPGPTAPRDPRPRWFPSRRLLAVALASSCAVIALLPRPAGEPSPGAAPAKSDVEPFGERPEEIASGDLVLPRRPGFLVRPQDLENLPACRVLEPGSRPIPWSCLLVAMLPIVVGLLLLRRERLDRRLPPPVDPPVPGSPEWEPWLEPEDDAFLSPAQRSRIVFGIDRYVHDVPSLRLDLARTVRETARQAGLPVVVRKPRVSGREVWFWLDQSASARGDVAAFADDVGSSLRQVGLPFERARFVGVPERLHFGAHHEAVVSNLEGMRGGAIVAVFTDGRGIARALAGNRRRRTERLLKELAEWPHLAFVDVGHEHDDERVDLAATLETYGLRVLRPAALLDFLAGRPIEEKRPAAQRDPAPLRRLAGAVALSWDPVPTAVARDLCRALRLPIEPFGVEALARAVETDPNLRARRLNDFLISARSSEGLPLAGFGPVYDAIRFFDGRLEAPSGDPDRSETGAGQWQRMDRALLRLIHDPDAAAVELHALHGGSTPRVRGEIRARLRRYSAWGAPRSGDDRDDGHEDRIVLPWNWPAAAGRTQRLLTSCGFGDFGDVRLRMSGRRAIAIGGLAGLAALLLATGGVRWWNGPRPTVLQSVPASAAWAEAIERIADRERSPEYAGLKLDRTAVMDALHPLGQDPDSRKWEFAILGSGTVPAPDEAGRLTWPDDGTGAVVLVLIPGGSFDMGAQTSDPAGRGYDPGAYDDESPVHRVSISPFFLAKHEMTQHQWHAWTGLTQEEMDRLAGSSATALAPRQPLVNVSWIDIEQVLEALGEPLYRLPTEAEWEYACRAGTRTAYWFGDDAGELEHYAWFDKNSESATHPVGEKPANPFGLFDIHGNVLEWCSDWYGLYTGGPAADPGGPAAGEFRVVRGGSFRYPAGWLRSAFRLRNLPGNRWSDLGFRLAVSAPISG